VELLVNELSLHGQFIDLASFRDAIQRFMSIRAVAHQFGRELHCHKDMAQARVTPTITMPQAIQALTHDERRAFLSWITRNGPFWKDIQEHDPDDWLEWNNEIVTDTAVGEAAWCCLNDIKRDLVSLTPSNWQFTPVLVDWISGSGSKKTIEVVNHWDAAALEIILRVEPVPMNSWAQLTELAMARCTLLTFSEDAFVPLNGHPFFPSAALRLLSVLGTLNRYKSCFDANGQRTTEGNELYQDFFTGAKGQGGRGAIFTDSSDDEKVKFKNELTFKHPDNASETLFCPWHGKVQTPQLRVHFSSPVRANEPLYVVFVGPKITKQ
jgi:hypothetical protein